MSKNNGHPDMIEKSEGDSKTDSGKGPEVYDVKDAPDKTDDFGETKQGISAPAEASQLRGLNEAELASLNPDNRQPRRADDAEEEASEFTQAEVEDARGAEEVKLLTFVIKIEKSETIHLNPRIYEHELPILEALWGPDKIEVMPATEAEVIVTFSAAQEYDRLMKCRGEEGAKAAKSIYGNASELARALGMAPPVRLRSYSTRMREQKQSAQRGTVQ